METARSRLRKPGYFLLQARRRPRAGSHAPLGGAMRADTGSARASRPECPLLLSPPPREAPAQGDGLA